jgi:hypothetical protein
VRSCRWVAQDEWIAKDSVLSIDDAEGVEDAGGAGVGEGDLGVVEFGQVGEELAIGLEG